MWQRLLQHEAGRRDMASVVSLMKESHVLGARDVLSYVLDTTLVDTFKPEICETLDRYEKQISVLRHEMEDYARAAAVLKEELARASEKVITVEPGKRCDMTCKPLLSERFYVFPCGHGFVEEIEFFGFDARRVSICRQKITNLKF